eukprot:1152182-Pelagomonas_calceolata.AAC.2
MGPCPECASRIRKAASSLGLHVSNSTDCLIPEIDARPLPPHVPPHPAKRAPGEGIQGATTAVLSSVRTWGAWASAVVERGCANASVQWQLTRHEVMEQLVGSRHWREVCWLVSGVECFNSNPLGSPWPAVHPPAYREELVGSRH